MNSIKEKLKGKLTEKELKLVPSSFDVVGSILIFSEFPKELNKKERIICRAFLEELKNVKTICKKTKVYSGTYRTPQLKIIAGEKIRENPRFSGHQKSKRFLSAKETTHKENNVLLKLDVEKVYFSPRLSNERLRISKLVKPNEDILVMFSGCAPYPCVLAKNTKANSIIGVEINPIGHKYALENLKLNKLTNVGLIKGDVRKILPKINKKFDRILMPLPRSAEDFLDTALKKAKKSTIIHFYDFLNEKEFDLAKEKVANACKKAKKKFKFLNLVTCGQFGPRIYRICLDFQIVQ